MLYPESPGTHSISTVPVEEKPMPKLIGLPVNLVLNLY